MLYKEESLRRTCSIRSPINAPAPCWLAWLKALVRPCMGEVGAEAGISTNVLQSKSESTRHEG